MLIPLLIDESEVLLRFVFSDNFKKKTISHDRINDQDIFLDTRLAGVSLQRYLYSNFRFCKTQAKSIASKVYVGFVVFKKTDYLRACEEYKKIRDNFESIIEYTPLDAENRYIIDRSTINISDEGNPSHCDIIYINPALLPNEIKPNISLRIFSKILYKHCKLIIDENYHTDSVDFNSIESYFE